MLLLSTSGWWWLGGRKSRFGLAEISSLLFLVLSKDGKQSEFRVSFIGGLQSKRCCDHKEGVL